MSEGKMNDAEIQKQPPPDARRNPWRLLAYFILLFFFIFLTSQLLSELQANYDIQKFGKINELIDQAFNFGADFEDVIVTIFSLLLSFIFILPIAWVYTLTKDEEDFDPSLVQTIVVLAMVVTGVMVVVGSDLARAFGLAGVVAAVRFRNTLKDTKDAVYVFIAVAIGMGCGYHVYHIAVFLSLIMTLTMFLLWKYKFGKSLRGGALSFAAISGDGEGSKGKKKAVQMLYDQSMEGASQRLGRELEQQVRLLQLAELMADKGKKKANAALIVESNDAQRAQQHLDKVLSAYGDRWQLANMATNAPGKFTLEYVGRLPKENTPAALIGALQANGASCIAGIEFRSLKGLKNPKAPAKVDEKVDAED
jgi:hypothetical protein